MATVSGMSKSRLSNLSKCIEKWIEDDKIPGASIAVYRKNKLVHESYHKYQSDTIFRIYSMTKPIVSIGLMILYERGLFKLRDPISLYIPSFDKRKLIGIYDYNKNDKNLSLDDIKLIKTKPIKSQIRIWQLLTHTSGLSYGFDINGLIEPVDKLYNNFGCNLRKHDNINLKQWIDQRLTKMPLLFEPGSRWNYSYATDVCGHLIEVLSKQTLDVFLKKNIFDPLNMNDTSFFIDNDKMHRFANLYMSSLSTPAMISKRRRRERGKKVDDNKKEHLIDITNAVSHNYDKKKNKFLSGGGGLICTLNDYMLFCKMLLNGGKSNDGNTRIISPKTLEFMTINHLKDNKDIISLTTDGYKELSQPGIGFGLGFSVILNEGRRASDGSGQISSCGSFSWGGAAETFFWIDPQEELCVVFMTQLMYNNRLKFDIRSKIQTLVYSSIVDDIKDRRRVLCKL